MIKGFVAFIVAILIMFLGTVQVYAVDDIKTKKDMLKDVNSSISDLKEKIDDVKGEKKDVLKELDRIENNIEEAQNSISGISAQIEYKNILIGTATEALNEAINNYKVEEELYGERIRVMYISGPMSYLEILLSSEGLSDFISRIDTVKTIMQHDQNILVQMKEKQDLIAQKKAELEKEKSELVQLKRDYSLKKSALDSANDEKQAYYDKLQKDQEALEKVLIQEENESRRLIKQIRELEEKLRRANSKLQYSGSKTGILKVSDIGHMPLVTSAFGMRYHPVLKKWKLHTGIDFGVQAGTPVYAMSDGEVIISSYLSGYGSTIAIAHGSGITSLYAHCSKLLVKEGQVVRKGQLIAKSGNTGYSTGPHLHFEIRKDGEPINPEPYAIIGQ